MVLIVSSCTTIEKSSADSIRTEVDEVQQSLFVIEREMPGVGNLTQEQLKEASILSNGVLSEMGPDIKWLHSYVTGDKIYCVYTATSEDKIREHALKSGFPANSVSMAGTVIDPSTGY